MSTGNADKAPAVEFLTTDELIEELRKRCPIYVIGYVTAQNPTGYHIRFEGAQIATLGLATQMLREVRAEMKTKDADA